MDVRGHVTIAETRKALREVYKQDGEINLQDVMRRALADDLKPINDKGHWKPSSLLILVGAILFALISIFAYFSIGGHV